MLSLKKYKDPLIQRTNAEEWRLEVERVAPSLKMTVKTDGRWTLKISFPILFFLSSAEKTLI